MTNKAVFFDRDGTINIDPGYIGNPNLVELYPGTASAIAELKKAGFRIVVISNQSGIARGYFTSNEVEAVNQKINSLLKDQGTEIDAFYYCPSHPDFNTAEECKCRKPSPYLVFKAAEEMKLDLGSSYFAGDSLSDIECGINAGIKTILVKNGRTEEQISSLLVEGKIPNFIACDLQETSKFIINDFLGGN